MTKSKGELKRAIEVTLMEHDGDCAAQSEAVLKVIAKLAGMAAQGHDLDHMQKSFLRALCREFKAEASVSYDCN